MNAAVVFLGPTLAWREADAVLAAVYLPPARQGDVFRAVKRHTPRFIGIVDGVFLDVASVWHREILWALSQGVHVFGAGSMGALRAAELAPFGMRGVGRIQAAYRAGRWPGYDEPFEDDDEVAVIHAPAEAGGKPLSDAMVDLRDTLLAAEAADVIDRAQRDALTLAMKQLHFRDRSFARLAEFAAGTALPDWLPGNIVRRKRLDALAMLATMGEMLGDASRTTASRNAAAGGTRVDPSDTMPPFQPAFRFERALVWEQFVAEADALDEVETQVLAELRLDPKAWNEVRRAALGRLHSPHSTDTAAERRQVERFRQERGLWRRADLDAWLQANALDLPGLERLLRLEAALEGMAARGGTALAVAMIDHLRLTGRFAELLRTVNARRRALISVPEPPAEPHLTGVLEWYFEQRLGVLRPASIAGFAAELGWDSEEDFVLAVWHEYLFNRIPK